MALRQQSRSQGLRPDREPAADHQSWGESGFLTTCHLCRASHLWPRDGTAELILPDVGSSLADVEALLAESAEGLIPG